MSQQAEDGSPCLPVFMSWKDCKAAVTQATEADEPDEELEIVGLSLPSVVERLSTIAADTPAFRFIPDSASAKHISEYLGY